MAAQLTSLLSFSSSHALANYKGDTSCFKVLHSSSHSARRRNRRVFCSSAQAPARETQAHPLSIWLESRDVPTKRLGSQPKIVEGKLCLVATRPTSSGQTLAAIPQKAWLTQQTVSQSPIGIFVEELDGWLQICLFLLHERSKQQSAWGPYLASLPQEVDLPLFWSETELQQLQGTQLQTSVEGYRAFFEGKYAELDAELFSRHREAFPRETFTLDAFLWAVATVRSRVHSPLDGDYVAMVPLADLVQHSRDGASKWVPQQAGGLFKKGNALVVEARRQVAEGEVITMDFGALPEPKLDSQVLLDYGTMDVDRGQGGFLLSLDLMEDDRFYDDKADVLEMNGLGESSSFILRPNEEPPEQLLGFLRLLNLQGQDSFLLEALFRNEAWGHMLAPISEANERAVYQSMLEGCQAALDGYETSAEEDRGLLRTVAPGSRMHKAILVRLGEKETLESTLKFFEDRFERLSDLEFYQERRLKRLGLLDDDGKSTYDDFFKDGIA